jgi:broad specificity polyphosphatase/5'/3'-nucleotidase SurE
MSNLHRYITRNGQKVLANVPKAKYWWANDGSQTFELKDVTQVDYEHKMGRLADAINTHIRASLRDKRYYDVNLPEGKITPNRDIAYGQIVYKTFRDHVNEAIEMIKLLNSK